MALQVFGTNSIGMGARANLMDTDDVLIASGATVGSTDSIGVYGHGSFHFVDVQGTVTGFDRAIWLGNALSDQGQRVTIGDNGYVASARSDLSAITIYGSDSKLDNAGTIRGAGGSVRIGGSDSGDTSIITNSGLIETNIGSTVSRIGGATDIIEVHNSGEIRTSAIFGDFGKSFYSDGQGIDRIFNSGLMVGDVQLGDSDDLFDGSGGRIEGEVSGNGGTDQIIGGAFVDGFFGGDGDDGLSGGGGDDNLSGEAGSDTMSGGAGNDDLSGGADADRIDGGDGDDAVDGSSGNDIMSGGAGNDSLFGQTDADQIDGGDGNDAVDGGTGNDIISGGAGDDRLFGFQDADKVDGGAGNDTVDGNTGNDIMSGGEGNDSLFGGADVDQIDGGAGNDVIDGGTGGDTMSGGAGNDAFFVDSAGDVVSEVGGSGVDRVSSLISFNFSDAVHAKGALENLVLTGSTAINGTGNALANVLTGNIAANVLSGLAGNDVLNGGGGGDQLVGGAGKDVLNGGVGADRLLGGLGIDVLRGQDGLDRLHGGAGKDTLIGGTGADTFVFDTAPNTATNRDIVTDFTRGQDKFFLENAVFAKLGAAGALKAGAFHVGTGAHDSDDRIVYNKATGILSYDADGNGTQPAVQLGLLTNKPVLTATDFAVI